MKRLGFISFIILLILLIITGFIVESSLLRFKGDVSTKIILLILFNFTLLALFTLIFFVGKSIIKLYFEKRNRITGYRFKTKLVIIFVAITLIPSTMLFVISSGLVTKYIDKWFAPQIQRPLNEALFLAKNLYDYIREDTIKEAFKISKGAQPSSRYQVSTIESPEGEISEAVKEAFKGKAGTEIISTEKGDVVIALVPIMEDKKVKSLLIVETLVPEELTKRLGSIQSSYEEYITLQTFKFPLKANYFVILGFYTLLIVFMALWIALKVSRGITEPLQSLVQATENVTDGNLDTIVRSNSDDEIGMLVNSFNRMVKNIKDAEISLHNAYLESDRRRLFMEHIVDNINSGVITIDSEEKVTTVNNAACRILNISAENILNKRYDEMLNQIESDELKEFIKGIRIYSFHSKKEQLKISVNGREMVLRIFIVRLEDEVKHPAGIMKKPVGLLVVFDDLTELIQAEKALTWQDVTRRITHEIKNPLTPIKLSAERILKRWENNDENFDRILEKSTNTIIREVNGLQRLVNEFSKLGKMSGIKKVPTDLKTLITDVVELYTNYESIDIEFFSNSSLQEISVDPENFKRVLINIMDNAVQSVDNNGKIDINASEDGLNNNIIIEIADNGKGINKEDKEKLFQPYFSKSESGTGLGLAISQRVITEHKGTITVADNKPRGTVFRIEIPRN